MKIKYQENRFNKQSLIIIKWANEIIEDYASQGFTLTLRQLYYQFVAKELIENSLKAYKALGNTINNARLSGLIDWESIEDRTRNLSVVPTWYNAKDIVGACSQAFKLDKWKNQPFSPEVWIEKEALVGVIDGICRQLQVPYFACRGYNSQSEQWRAGIRFNEVFAEGRTPIVIHLGDHDPSGIDMTRDNLERLSMFAESPVEIDRIALNMEQIKLYEPPPNPAKITDSRFADYADKYGQDSWELDALNPNIIVSLIKNKILSPRDDDLWDEMVRQENKEKDKLEKIMESM